MKYFNPIEQYLDKPAEDFTKADLIKFFFETEKKMVNLLYIGDDSRIKTLTFIITSQEYLDTILTHGERIDGSSIFESVDASSSDLYIVPIFKTAFISPFAHVPTVSFFCRIFESNGEPFKNSIVNTLIKARNLIKEKTGYDFRTLGELEYYVISEETPYYPMPEQKGYHTSTPFSKWANIRKEAMLLIAESGGKIKYGHTEVGTFYYGNQYYEQHEIEFLPTSPEETAFQLIKAKWILRNLSEKYNVFISFAPKIAVGKAGSGLHFHFQLIKDNEDVMIQDRKLSDVAK
ncbi:MAG TPA: glutamine synthetase, partial [Bacteroidales bacterium]|nr:glutamine synthetase [Bacteroidales bacterium]